MYVALTGTPGTGKTTVAELLRKQNIAVLDLFQIASQHNFFLGVDTTRNSKILDLEDIHNFLQEQKQPQHITLIEGHASHLLPIINKVILLRCHPRVLKKRLQKKQWNSKKINENMQAEILDVILCETTELFDINDIFEINTTNKKIADISKEIAMLHSKDFTYMKKYKIGQIDWSEEILRDL